MRLFPRVPVSPCLRVGLSVLLLASFVAIALAQSTGTSGPSLPWIDARYYSSLTAAQNAAVTNGKGVMVSTSMTVSGMSITVPLSVVKGGMLTVASGQTVTVTGSFDAGRYQVFSGSGSVVFTTVKEVLPEWWGAKADGSTDSRSALQSAVDSLAPSGGLVRLSSGTYLIGSFSSGYYTVRPRSGVSVNGAGPASIIKFKDNLRTSTQGLSFLYDNDTAQENITYSDFTVDWNGQNNLVSAGNTATENINRMGGAAGMYNVHFRNMTFKNAAGAHHIYISNGNAESNSNGRCSVIGCTFLDAGKAITGNTNVTDHTSLYLDAPNSSAIGNTFTMSNLNDSVSTAMETHDRDIVLEGNTVYGYNTAVNIGAQVQNTSGIRVLGNVVNQTVQGAVLWTAGTYSLSDISIVGNDFRLRENNILASVAVNATASTMAGSVSGSRISIKSNRFRQLTQSYPDLSAPAIFLYRWDGISIQENEITNFTGEAVYIEAEVGVRRISSVDIKGNTMIDCGTTSVASNKRFIAVNAGPTLNTDDISNVNISGNSVVSGASGGTAATYGITLNSGRLPNLRMVNNSFTGLTSAELNSLNTTDTFKMDGFYPDRVPSLASASTITINSMVTHITGSVDIFNITPPAGHSGLVTLITDSGNFFGKTGNIIRPYWSHAGESIPFTYDASTAKWYPPSKDVFYTQATPSTSVTGTTALTSLWTTTIPGGMLGSNGRLEIDTIVEVTNNANLKNVRVWYGGTEINIRTLASVPNYQFMSYLINLGAENSNGYPYNTLGLTNFNGFTKSALNTAVDQQLKITTTPTSTLDTISLRSVGITIKRGD